MNATDRKAIAALLKTMPGAESFHELSSEIEELADAEQEKFDNMTEGLQQGERGQAIEEAAAQLSEAKDKADEIANLIEELDGILSDIANS